MIESKTDYQQYLAKDLANGSFKKSTISYFLSDTWKFLRLLRLLEYITNTKSGFQWKIIKFIVTILFKSKSKKLGYSIPPNVFGPGLMLPHYGNIIVNPKVRIGANCKIHVGTNIGAAYDDSDAVPTIGDNCYIAPGAKIFGDIVIANYVKIGANAVVNKSCFIEHANLLGIPAKIYPPKA